MVHDLCTQTMAHLIIVAHAPLAHALAQVGRHAFPEHSQAVTELDVEADEPPEQIELRLRELLRVHGESLVLVDVFGGTPGNAAWRAVDGARARLVYGANVAMVWRSLSYRSKPLAERAELAAAGAVQGVMAMTSSTRPQNQSNTGAPNDQNFTEDQQ